MKYEMINDGQVAMLTMLASTKEISDETCEFIISRFDMFLIGGSAIEDGRMVQAILNSDVVLITMFASMIAGFISGQQYQEMNLRAMSESINTVNKFRGK